jgi:hypothetical protein
MVVYPNIYPFMHTKDKKLLKLGLECLHQNMTFMIGQNMTTNQT